LLGTKRSSSWWCLGFSSFYTARSARYPPFSPARFSSLHTSAPRLFQRRTFPDTSAMLTVFAPYAFESLRKRRYGSLYSLLLVAVAVFSFAYSSVFASRNPYTNNPYGLSLTGLVSYGDAQQIRTLSQMLAPGTYLTDWRSGNFIASTYLDIQPRYRGFRYKGVEFIYGGSYGLYVDLAHL